MARFGSHVASTFKRYFLPTRLLVYRDGLSDGELVNVGKMEIEALKGVYSDIMNGIAASLTLSL